MPTEIISVVIDFAINSVCKIDAFLCFASPFFKRTIGTGGKSSFCIKYAIAPKSNITYTSISELPIANAPAQQITTNKVAATTSPETPSVSNGIKVAAVAPLFADSDAAIPAKIQLS